MVLGIYCFLYAYYFTNIFRGNFVGWGQIKGYKLAGIEFPYSASIFSRNAFTALS